jgi:hypothetical protein
MRTRMSGGVGGAPQGLPADPYPDLGNSSDYSAPSDIRVDRKAQNMSQISRA